MDIVTLTTDFGTKDYYSALLKGEILKAAPRCRIIDISHNIERHDIMSAAFFVKGIYLSFPKQTLHIVAVNTYYAPTNELILFENDGYFFLGSNNGVFSLVFPDIDPRSILEVPMNSRENIYQSLSLIVGRLFQGKMIHEIGMPVQNYERRLALQAVISSDYIRATIMHVDVFGNVVVNLDRKTFERVRDGRKYAIYYKSDNPISTLSHRYSNVTVGDACAFFNDIGMLEIAINMGNAHQLLGLNKNETIQIDFY